MCAIRELENVAYSSLAAFRFLTMANRLGHLTFKVTELLCQEIEVLWRLICLKEHGICSFLKCCLLLSAHDLTQP